MGGSIPAEAALKFLDVLGVNGGAGGDELLTLGADNHDRARIEFAGFDEVIENGLETVRSELAPEARRPDEAGEIGGNVAGVGNEFRLGGVADAEMLHALPADEGRPDRHQRPVNEPTAPCQHRVVFPLYTAGCASGQRVLYVLPEAVGGFNGIVTGDGSIFFPPWAV